jgi:hypothetical protein
MKDRLRRINGGDDVLRPDVQQLQTGRGDALCVRGPGRAAARRLCS